MNPTLSASNFNLKKNRLLKAVFNFNKILDLISFFITQKTKFTIYMFFFIDDCISCAAY